MITVNPFSQLATSVSPLLMQVFVFLMIAFVIGGTLLERNFAKIICRNSITRNGAEVIIRWKNNDLLEL